MPSPKQGGQPSGGMFQKYTGEQINQIPEGYVQGMGAMGQAYANIGQSIGSALIKVGEIKANEAKLQGQLAPYLVNTNKEIDAGLKSGSLIKDSSGNVVPNEANGITAAMVDTYKLDLYNKTGGDVSKLSGNDLTKFAASFESAQTIAKLETEKATTALKNAKTTAEIADLNSKIAERKAAADWMAGVGNIFSGGGGVPAPTGLNNGALPTVQGTTTVKEAPVVQEPGSNTAFVNNNVTSTGASVNTAAPVSTTAPTTSNEPTSAKADSYAEVNQTPEQIKADISMFKGQIALLEASSKGVYNEDIASDIASLNEKVDSRKKLLKKSNENGVAPEDQWYYNNGYPQDETPTGTASAKPTVNPATVPAPGTPAPSAATQAKKAPPPAAAAQTTNESVIPTAPTTPSVAEQITTLNTKRTNLVAARDKDLTELKTKLDYQKTRVASGLGMAKTTPMATAALDFIDRSYKLQESAWNSKIEAVDSEIKGVQNVAAANESVVKAESDAEKLKISKATSARQEEELKLSKEKAAREVAAGKREDISGHPRIGVFRWIYDGMPEEVRLKSGIASFSVSQVNEMRDQNVGFVKAQGFLTKLDDTLNQRTRGGGDYWERFRLTAKNLENWATAELADIFGVATFRKAIVSGGNFSDSDRLFVQKAIAYLNSLDPINQKELYKAKVTALGKFINSMYIDGFKANGYVFNEESMKADVDYFKSIGDFPAATAAQKQIDEYKSFSSRFMVNQDSQTGFMSAEEVLKAREELWKVVGGDDEVTEKDGRVIRLRDSNPAKFKRGL